MKGRLLFALLIMATIMLIMYYRLTLTHTELVTGFITLIAVFITHIVNVAQDILAELFKQPDTQALPASTVAPQSPSTTLGLATKASTATMVLICCLFISNVSWAKTTVNNTYVDTTINPTAVVVTEKVQAGPELDAPKLVKLTQHLYLGLEGGKDMVYTNTSKGWFGFAKVTWDWTAIDLTKKKGSND
jgi:hypothetical protein